MTLKGPDNADHYRVKVGRYNDRWYSDPLPADDTWTATPDDEAYPSISTVKKAGGSDWTYVALKRVAQHEGPLPQGVDARYAALKNINDLGLKQAQKRGTGVHAIAEARLRGFVDPMAEPNDDAELYRPAVNAFFDTYQPTLAAVEFVAIHRDLNGVGYGGTGDAVLTIEGKHYLVDWKSRGADSDHGGYPEEAAQIAGYARAQYWIVDGPARIAPLELAGGLIVSIKPDGFRVYPVDLDKAFDHWQAMHAWWCARRDERKPVGRPWAPRKVEQCKTKSSSETGTIESSSVAATLTPSPKSSPAPTTTTPSTRPSSTPSVASSPERADPCPETPNTSDSASSPTTSTSSAFTPSPSSPMPITAPPPASSDNSLKLDWIRHRIRQLPPNAMKFMWDRWPIGVPRGPAGPFTDYQLNQIHFAVGTAEWQFNIIRPTLEEFAATVEGGGEAPDVAPTVEPAPTFKPPEEGPEVELDEVKKRITALPAEQQALFNRILVEAKDAGRSFHVLKNKGGMPSLRRACIVHALADIIDAADGDEDLIRYALGFAMGQEVQPAVTLGCAVGSLTVQEAARLSALATALKNSTAHLTFSEDGTPVFGGTAAIFAA